MEDGLRGVGKDGQKRKNVNILNMADMDTSLSPHSSLHIVCFSYGRYLIHFTIVH